MAVDLSTIQTGMDVLDPTGEKIGTIDDILDVQTYQATDTGTTYQDPATGTAGDVAVTTVAANPSADRQYLKVKHGGVLGIGATDLYVPLSAVRQVSPEDTVTIDCTVETCQTMYGTKPSFLP